MCSSSRSLFLASSLSLSMCVPPFFPFSLSLRHPPVFFSVALVTHGYLSFYTPDGQVLLPLHARTVRDYLVRASMRTFFFAN